MPDAIPTMLLDPGSIAIVDRGRKKITGIPDLLRSIKENGQITPIQVRRATPEDQQLHDVDPSVTPWVLVAGGRRLTAHIMGALSTVRAEDFGELPPLRQKEIELEENLNREDLDWHESTAMVAEIHKLKTEKNDGKWTMGQTAKAVKQTTANVSRELKLAEEIRKDPNLKQASSKVAALRLIDLREATKKRAEAPETSHAMRQLTQLLKTADARDFLRAQETGSIDLLLSDFPFGHDHFKTNMRHSYATEGAQDIGSGVYDDSQAVSLDLFVDIIPECIRVTKETGWLAIMMGELNFDYVVDLVENCCATHFSYRHYEWKQDENGDWIKNASSGCPVGWDTNTHQSCKFLKVESPYWTWFRPNSNNVSNWPERHAGPDYERIIVVNRGEGRIFNPCRTTLVHDADYGSRLHTHQKPISLAKDLVTRLSLLGNVVCDPCFGSGALLAGAAALGRIPLGCDNNPMNLDKAVGYVGEYFSGTARKLPD